MRIIIGTSSWADPGFVKEWYPRDLSANERLPFYAERFEGVEVNSTFYAVPARETVSRWVEQTADNFQFDIKLHRLLSRHTAALDSLPPNLRSDAKTDRRGNVELEPRIEASSVEAILSSIEPLVSANRFASFLQQLSPSFSPRKHQLDELATLLKAVSPLPVAVELRNRNWAKDDLIESTLEWMSEHNAVWVAVDAPKLDHFTVMPAIDAVTSRQLAYLRAHGRNAHGYLHGRSVAERFAWRYSDDELGELKERVESVGKQLDKDGEIHVMFNNNRGNDAPVAARRMRELLGQDPGPPVQNGGDQLRLAE